MMRRIFFWTCLFVCAASIALFQELPSHNREEDSEEAYGMEPEIMEQNQWQQRMLADPHTGEIPAHMRMRELAFTYTLPVADESLNKASNMGFWFQRGPYNVGGRTRAIAVDLDYESTIIAGAASGGIWKSENAGAKWWKVSRTDSFGSVTCLTQDPRKGKHAIWYAGTGEYFGGYVPGQYYTGSGIQKSTDNGNTWVSLRSTQSNSIQFDNMFDFIHRVAVNPAIDSIDVVFAATYGCIFRSLNGGMTWQTRRGNASSPSTWTDIAISKKGIIYCTLSGNGSNAGIWRSVDNGQTWINITPTYFSATTGRIVLAIAPSDENQVYFAAYTPNAGKKSTRFDGQTEWNSLWKYTYKSGNGADSGGVWEDRSANLPGIGGAFGDFISQQGYSLSIQVKPDNPEVVILGGTNLYRSTDGFKTNTHTTWIGGYKPGTVLPDFKTYPNHHPDQHLSVFYPKSSAKMLSVHDGGISRTNDITASEIQWESLNNGYHTVQFYGTAIDATSDKPAIAGGLQDNGTLFNGSSDNSAPWTLSLSYDGGYCYLGPNVSEAYMTIQSGRIYRMVLDANGNATQSARIDCKDAVRADYEFINPFTPAIDNYYTVYNPCGQLIWRNKDIRQIPLHAQLDSTPVSTGWTALESTRINDASDAITAITSASGDIVYYGTSKGKLLKVEQASSDSVRVSDLRKSNLPTGYINCIAVDPHNANNIYVVYANYGILSVFASNDAGQSWQAISGNLEENSSGSGNGPSCRWFTFASIQGHTYYYLGTSTGLFACDSLNGMNTVWVRQSPERIGVNIVTMMQFRERDGLMAVSTFGAGMFAAYLTSTKDQSGLPKLQEQTCDIYPNPTNHEFTIRGLNKPALARIIDMQGHIYKEWICQPYETVSVLSYKPGTYVLQLEWDGNRIVKRFIRSE